MNTEYTVTYEMTVTAEDPEDAAQQADEDMRDPERYPPILSVRGPDGVTTDVDLADDEDEES